MGWVYMDGRNAYSQIEAELFIDMGLKWTGEGTGHIAELTNLLNDHTYIGNFNKSIDNIIEESTQENLVRYLERITESLRLRTEDQESKWRKRNIHDDIETAELLKGFTGHKEFFEKMHNLAISIKIYAGIQEYIGLEGVSQWNKRLETEIFDNLAAHFDALSLRGGKIIKNKRSKKRNTRKKMSKKKDDYNKKIR